MLEQFDYAIAEKWHQQSGKGDAPQELIEHQLVFLSRVVPIYDLADNERLFTAIMRKPDGHRHQCYNRAYTDIPEMLKKANFHSKHGMWAKDDLTKQYLTDENGEKISFPAKSYFALGRYDTTGMGTWDDGSRKYERKGEFATHFQSFWMDIDGKNGRTPETIAAAVHEFFERTDAMDFSIDYMLNLSGGGIHCYLPLDEPMPRNVWEPIANRISDWVVKELGADDDLTNDAARVLSLPGTYNKKKDYAPDYPLIKVLKDVECQDDDEENPYLNTLDAILSWLDENNVPKPETVKKYAVSKPVPSTVQDTEAGEAVLAGCPQLQRLADDWQTIHDARGALGPYDPHFQKLVSNLAHVSNGEQVLRNALPEYTDWLDKDKGHTHLATVFKRYETQYSPHSCRSVKEGFEAACDGCPLNNKPGASPFNLAQRKQQTVNRKEVEASFLKDLYPALEAVQANLQEMDLVNEQIPVDVEAILRFLRSAYHMNSDRGVAWSINEAGELGKIGGSEPIRQKLMEKRFEAKFFRPEPIELMRLIFEKTSTAKDAVKDSQTQISAFKASIIDMMFVAIRDQRSVSKTTWDTTYFSKDTDVSKGTGGHTGSMVVTRPQNEMTDLPRLPDGVDAETVGRDFSTHFKDFEAFLGWVADVRFASSRRQAYLWLHCCASGGKTFLAEGVLQELGLAYVMSEDDFKDVFTSSTAGLKATDVLGKHVIGIDEATSVNRHLKFATESMPITSKNEPTQVVATYGKLLMSKEVIEGLGKNKADEQFCERFAYIRMTESKLSEHPLFVKIGKYRYITALKHYVKSSIQKRIDEYVALGEEKATILADERLEKFHADYALEKTMGSNTGAKDDFVQDLFAHIQDVCSADFFYDMGAKDVIRVITDKAKTQHPNLMFVLYKGVESVLIKDLPSLIDSYFNYLNKSKYSNLSLKKSDAEIEEMLLHILETECGAEDNGRCWVTYSVLDDSFKGVARSGKKRGLLVSRDALLAHGQPIPTEPSVTIKDVKEQMNANKEQKND